MEDENQLNQPVQDISHLDDARLQITEEDLPSMQDIFQVMSEAHQKRLSIPRSSAFTRKQVVNAFHTAFELIGGVPRLASWAHVHPTEFFKLYARLLPNQSTVDFGKDGTLKIVHSLAPSALDQLPLSMQKVQVPKQIIEGEIISE